MPSLSFVTAVVALALPLATSVSATSHYSHPRLTRSHQRAVSRALPRSGRRLVARGGEATLKCLTDYTFALCDGSNCTDMGSVAAGTKCVDGAITWDTSSEASTQDSNAASASVESAPVPAVAPSVSSTTSAAAPSASTLDGSDATAAGTSAGVQLHVTNGGNDGDDDYVCDDDSDDSSSSSSGSSSSDSAAWGGGTRWTDRGKADSSSGGGSSSTAVATPTGAAATADFSAVAPTSSSNAQDVQLFASSAAPSSTTTPTTSEAPAQTSAPPSSGGGQVYNGKATYYYQYGVAGSCGVYNSDSTYIVALSYEIVDNGAHCGQKVSIKNTANGKSITATVADTCPGCASTHLDLSEGAFLALGDLSSGVIPIEWSFQ